jgi:tRNA(Met) cytidine acetyltransferase
LLNFYNLLSLAHYKTTPTDLRRLFDGENQSLFDIRENGLLVAGCWAVNEGGLGDELTQAIWRGERRPKGSLVAQYLCFQGNLPQACRLRSLRISRIAVQTEMQSKGYGKRLISGIILQLQDKGLKPLAMESGNDLARSFIPLYPPLSKPLDFLSVSFGMSDELLHFWQQCGFRLVQVSQNKEASSGLYSAMMIYPLSAQGKDFAKLAERQFLRDQHLQKNGEKQPLDESDWQNIYGFIHHQRTFSACRAALQRLYQHDSIKFSFLNKVLRAEKMDKAAIKMLKANLLQWLE